MFDSPDKAKQPKRENSSSQKSCASDVISPAKSEAHSSYRGSGSEEDMFADSFEGETTLVESQPRERGDEGEVTGPNGSQSLRSYVSGDEDVPEEDQASSPQFQHLTSRDDLEVDLDADFPPDDGGAVEEEDSGGIVVADSGVPRSKRLRLDTSERAPVRPAESPPHEAAGKSAHAEGADEPDVEEPDRRESSESPAEAPDTQRRGKVGDRKKLRLATDTAAESRDSPVQKPHNSKDRAQDSDLEAGLRNKADEAGDGPFEKKVGKANAQADDKELESEKENSQSDKRCVENPDRGDFNKNADDSEKADGNGGDELEPENV